MVSTVQDVGSCVKGKGFCYCHNGPCKLPSSDGLILFTAGFVCKANSAQNGRRWVVDPLSVDSSSRSTFESTLAVLKSTRPTFFCSKTCLEQSYLKSISKMFLKQLDCVFHQQLSPKTLLESKWIPWLRAPCKKNSGEGKQEGPAKSPKDCFWVSVLWVSGLGVNA